MSNGWLERFGRVTWRVSGSGAVFTSDFDRALRVANEVTSEPEDDPARYVDGEEMPQDPAGWGRHHFGETARELLQFDEWTLATIEDLDAQMLEQLAEDPDEIVDYDVSPSDWELTDPDVREAVRAALEPRVAEARGHWLADQSIDARDRPGDPPPWIEEVRDLDLADIRTADDTTPGCFILPPPLDALPPSGPSHRDKTCDFPAYFS